MLDVCQEWYVLDYACFDPLYILIGVINLTSLRHVSLFGSVKSEFLHLIFYILIVFLSL